MLAAFLGVFLLAGGADGKGCPASSPSRWPPRPVPRPLLSPAPAAASCSGGAAAARAPRRASVEDPDAPTPTGGPFIQARADCWIAVEHQHELRGIDQRIGFVEKCVARNTKSVTATE